MILRERFNSRWDFPFKQSSELCFPKKSLAFSGVITPWATSLSGCTVKGSEEGRGERETCGGNALRSDEKSSGAQRDWEDAIPIFQGRTNSAMHEINPYRIQAGPELDRLVHIHVMRQPNPEIPPYSTDEKESRRVLNKLKTDLGRTVITGRTAMRKQTWFARYETNPSDGTEVLAETLELAICRLALVRASREEPLSPNGPA